MSREVFLSDNREKGGIRLASEGGARERGLELGAGDERGVEKERMERREKKRN